MNNVKMNNEDNNNVKMNNVKMNNVKMNNRFPTCNPPVASCDPPDPISEEESFD
jgi:hypothetical protein